MEADTDITQPFRWGPEGIAELLDAAEDIVNAAGFVRNCSGG